MTDDTIFITGTHRSGTTLLDRLINQFPDVSILSQPFPLLFVETKRSFFRSLGLDDIRYPLGHLFLEERYDHAMLADFLRRWRTSHEHLRAIFEDMRGYSGQYTRFSDEEVERAIACVDGDDDFASVVQKLIRSLCRREKAAWFGSKETICEELLPSMLDRGFRCVLIIRDPRDVIASLNHGRGAEFGGSIKPLLFNIRSWRKSVAYALDLQARSRFQWCRYEDLVRTPVAELARIAAPLGLKATSDGLTSELRNGDGSIWAGNSSHGELYAISDASVGIYKKLLDPDVQRMVEAACLPELRYLGYDTSLTHAEAQETLRTIREPYPVIRTGMEDDLADSNNAKREIERLAKVVEAPSTSSTRWFLFERAHVELREVSHL